MRPSLDPNRVPVDYWVSKQSHAHLLDLLLRLVLGSLEVYFENLDRVHVLYAGEAEEFQRLLGIPAFWVCNPFFQLNPNLGDCQY